MDELIKNYLSNHFKNHKVNQPKVAGKDYLPPSGKVLDEEDLANLVEASMDLWLTAGRFATQFEKEFARRMESNFSLLTNSGSSANLLAVSALTSETLKDRAIRPGDEVITVAASFPTTVNPIIQNKAYPVFCDVELGTYNIDPSHLEKALSSKSKAVILAHTLGNPFDLKTVKEFCDQNNLWLIEDCCDALGGTWDNKSVGTFGDLATASFYPAHHITMGEGGAIFGQDRKLRKLVECFRDWGRDCWCPPGVDNTCGKRFEWDLGELPSGYDHKYIYSHQGYNLKVTDMQAAIGVSQLKKLSQFVDIRRRNFDYYQNQLKKLEEFLILPKELESATASWFGLPLTVRPETSFKRVELTQFLEKKKIGTRNLFGGNLVRQPLFKKDQYRIATELTQSDIIMEQTFWIGLYPGLNFQHIDYICEQITNFFKGSE